MNWNLVRPVLCHFAHGSLAWYATVCLKPHVQDFQFQVPQPPLKRGLLVTPPRPRDSPAREPTSPSNSEGPVGRPRAARGRRRQVGASDRRSSGQVDCFIIIVSICSFNINLLLHDQRRKRERETERERWMICLELLVSCEFSLR
jgi:hypothetical protein